VCIHRGDCSYVYEYLHLYCVTSEKKRNILTEFDLCGQSATGAGGEGVFF
jgi:hypothetical protein